MDLQRIRSEALGFVALPGDVASRRNPFSRKDRVWIAAGPWKDRVGVVYDIDREATFLKLEGTPTFGWVHVADLDLIKG